MDTKKMAGGAKISAIEWIAISGDRVVPRMTNCSGLVGRAISMKVMGATAPAAPLGCGLGSRALTIRATSAWRSGRSERDRLPPAQWASRRSPRCSCANAIEGGAQVDLGDGSKRLGQRAFPFSCQGDFLEPRFVHLRHDGTQRELDTVDHETFALGRQADACLRIDLVGGKTRLVAGKREGHREAGRMCGRQNLLGIGTLPVVLEPIRKTVGMTIKRAGLGADLALPLLAPAFPMHARGFFDHGCSLTVMMRNWRPALRPESALSSIDCHGPELRRLGLFVNPQTVSGCRGLGSLRLGFTDTLVHMLMHALSLNARLGFQVLSRWTMRGPFHVANSHSGFDASGRISISNTGIRNDDRDVTQRLFKRCQNDVRTEWLLQHCGA